MMGIRRRTGAVGAANRRNPVARTFDVSRARADRTLSIGSSATNGQ